MKQSAAERNCTPLMRAIGALAVLCSLGQSHNVVEGVSSPELGPLGPNPLALQADPNFLRFGRSGIQQIGQQETGAEHWKRAPAATSANFLRFGKAAPSEPNFLRFGKSLSAANQQAKRLMNSAQRAVDPSFLRFGRASSTANNFLRFGRTPEDSPLAMEEAFEREYRQPNPNFLRFG